MSIKFKSNEEGKCPICNSQMLEYFGMELEDTAVYFPWHCPDCDADGKEWYYVNFSEVRDNNDTIGETEGICPNCGGEIEYGTAEPEGNSLGYEYFCSDCGGSGIEWYDLDFDSHTIDGHENEDIIMEGKQLTEAEDEGYYAGYADNHKDVLNKLMSLWQLKKDKDGNKFVLDCSGKKVEIYKPEGDKKYSLFLDDKWYMEDNLAVLKRMGINFYLGQTAKSDVEKTFKDNNIALDDVKTEAKRVKTETVSYSDLVRAGEDLWRDGAVIRETKVDGIYDCNTSGHGGYLVDIDKHPELAKYGEKTYIDNIVGFEEDYEALKVIWVYPEVLASIQLNSDFIENLTIDQVTKYDLTDDFKNEFPERKAWERPKEMKTEAEMDITDMFDEYKKAYHKELDIKRVPCVIARDTMMSGWGMADGKKHYQVVLCADSTEAYNTAHNMQSKAREEGLANIRTSFGIQLPRGASVSYNVGRYASAWNMGDSWYERYDKKEEGRYKLDVVKYNMLHDKFKNDKRSYDELSDEEKVELDTYRDLTKKVYNSTRDHRDIKSEALTTNYGGQDLTKPVAQVEKALKDLVDKYNAKADKKVEPNGEQNKWEYINKTVSADGHKAFMVKFNLDEIGGLLTGGYEIIYRGMFIDIPNFEVKDYAYGRIEYKLNDKDELEEPVQEYDTIDEFVTKINDVKLDELITEARNTANDEVNAMIRSALNGSTKYVKNLEDLGFVLDKYGPNGKVNSMHYKDGDRYLYRGKLRRYDKDADLYNYLTKERPTSWEEQLKNGGTEAQKYMSSEKDITDNGYKGYALGPADLGKAIPKRFKTGKSTMNITEPYGSDKIKKYKEITANIASKKDDIKDSQAELSELDADTTTVQNNINKTQSEIDQLEKDKKALVNNQKTEAISPDTYNKIKNEPRSENYNKGLKIRDELVKAWKNKDLKTAYDKWSDLHDLFSTGYDDEGNQTAEWTEEQSLRDMIELTSITDTIEDKCVYDVTDYGKRKAYAEMGY